jgi:menaquinone-dependent protoporphyrinogen IX oxidase
VSGIILYQSKYGATKRYAEWISEETGFTCVETKRASIEEVIDKDVIILGGGLYASGIAGLSFLEKNIGKMQGKKIIVFCCCASPYDEEGFKQIVQHNMKDKLSVIPCFYCRGAWDLKAMSFKDRTLCNLLRKSVAKKTRVNMPFGKKP